MTERGPLAEAVADALNDAQLLPRDFGTVQLVRRYAQLLDEARGLEVEFKVYADLGPKLLAALHALGMTVTARLVRGGVPDGPGVGGKLDELRARRARRAG